MNSILLPSLHNPDPRSRRFFIETRDLGANPAWEGWKVTRRYARRIDRDRDLVRLHSVLGWAYRAAEAHK
jgi:hypothetical protein